MSKNGNQPVIIENGSAYCKGGFSGSDNPETVFPSVIVGTPKKPNIMISYCDSKFIGFKAEEMRCAYALEYPIERGIITNWNAMESIWDYCFLDIQAYSKGKHLCLSETSLNPKREREKTTEIMFEKYELANFFLAKKAVLSLFEGGRTTGLVLSSGKGVTEVVPIFDGYALEPNIMKNDFAGIDITNCLINVLPELNYSCPSIELSLSKDKILVREIKEKTCFIALDYESELSKFNKNCIYELPDGNKVTLGSQMFKCPEALFKPNLFGKNYDGIHTMIHKCINNLNNDIKALELYKNIVLSGGNTLFQGLDERLIKELSELQNGKFEIKINGSKERKNMAWRGGSIMTSLSSFKERWITKAEFEENGSAIIQKKCI